MQDTFCHSFLQRFSMTHSFIKTRTPTCNEQVLFLASKNLFTLPHTSTYICTISKNALETLHNNCLKYSREILFHHLKLLQTIHTSTYITLLVYLDPLRLKTDFALCLCSNAIRARIRALIVRRFLDASRAWTSSWQAANNLTIPSRICTSWSIFSWMAESSSSYIQKNNFGIE